MAAGAPAGAVVAAAASDPLTLTGFAAAGVAGVAVLAAGVAGLLRLVRRGRGADRSTASGPLDRLDYLPSVTSRVLRLRWHGSRYWSLTPSAERIASVEERTIRGVSARPRIAPAVAASSGRDRVDGTPAVPGGG